MFLRAVFLTSMGLLASACFTTRYLTQAAAGQYELIHLARPISQVVADPATPPRLAALLAHVDGLKAFARDQGLTPTGSYARFSDLRRPAAVWVVQGCAPLAFEPKRWQFPIVGTVPYLGFFDEARAVEYSKEVAKEGLDVTVRGAAAYSTLGWFKDPVLSTMVPDDDAALGGLANVILHESVHATVYVKDQSSFDESLASFVADRLTQTWFNGRLPRLAQERAAWLEGEAQGEARLARLHRAYAELDAVYRSSRSDQEKRAEKARVFSALNREFRPRRPLNNASLVGYRTYSTGTAAFERLLVACEGDFARMLKAVGTLKPKDFAAPQSEAFEGTLDALVARGCEAP